MRQLLQILRLRTGINGKRSNRLGRHCAKRGGRHYQRPAPQELVVPALPIGDNRSQCLLALPARRIKHLRPQINQQRIVRFSAQEQRGIAARSLCCVA